MKSILKTAFLFCFLFLLTIPVLAENEPTLVDKEELDSLLAPLLEEYGANEENFGLAFYYSGSGETYYYNEEKYFYAASLYKVPLCMVYAEKVASGERQWSDKIRGAQLQGLVERTLIYSDNDTASLLKLADPELAYTHNRFARYSAYTEEELKSSPSSYYFTPRFMLNTLITLYEEPERFPLILESMKQAAPEHFFRKELEGTYEIAQKYGQMEGVLHTAGIIYTPTPIILVVMCEHVPEQKDAIENLALFFSEYSLTLDARREEIEAEQSAKEAEEELHRLEEEERRIAAEAEAAQAAASEEEMEIKTPDTSVILFCIVGAALLLGIAAFLRRKR